MPDVSSGLQSDSWLVQTQSQAQATRLQQMQNQWTNPTDGDRKKLKKAAQEFEAVFVQQLLDAMDKTVSRENSVMGGGSAEEYWRGMMNEEISRSMTSRPGGSGFGLAEAIYRQMSQHLGPENTDKPNSHALNPAPSNQSGRF